MRYPSVTAVANVLAHAPGMIRHGSKPSRDLAVDPSAARTISAHTRTYESAVGYAPNQVYLGNLLPEALLSLPRPWFETPDWHAPARGLFGDMLDERALLGLLKVCDRARLVHLDHATLDEALAGLRRSALIAESALGRVSASPASVYDNLVARGAALPLWSGDAVVGAVAGGDEHDAALTAGVLLENLAAKATGVLALTTLLRQVRDRLDPSEIDFVIAGSEEAVGDRYQRGGGNIAKAIAEEAGLTRASGMDIKAFCASTLHTLFHAAALIQAGVFSRVVVVAGGSLAKLGMKYRAHTAKGMPVLEDVIAGLAILVERNGSDDPVVRLDTLGLHTIGSGSSQQAIVENLVLEPLAKAGYQLSDVDRYATEMHNPEVTEPAGAGNVPAANYRLIGALGVLKKQIPHDGLDAFVAAHGIPGFAPTQGHIASAVCYLAHARAQIRAGKLKRVLFMAKGSLFLGRMTEMSDGVSFLVE